jgi:hypothetical protein
MLLVSRRHPLFSEIEFSSTTLLANIRVQFAEFLPDPLANPLGILYQSTSVSMVGYYTTIIHGISYYRVNTTLS